MTVSKASVSNASLSQHVEKVKHYAKPAAEIALAVDGTIRIWNAFQQKRAGVNLLPDHHNQINNPADSATGGAKAVKTVKAPKRSWDILARFCLTPAQNVIVGVTEIAVAACLYKR